MMFRAEKHGLMLFDYNADKTHLLPAERFELMQALLDEDGKEGWEPDSAILKAAKRFPSDFFDEMALCEGIKSPPNAYRAPVLMNLELTTRCPLHCPQCYCDLHRGKDLPLETALKYIGQAVRLKIPFINLSGGETMVYPHLLKLIEACSNGGLHPAVALSGYGFDRATLSAMRACGIGDIYISLNGSTQEVNACTRDGYELAVEALRVLRASSFRSYAVNWVAHRTNIDDFENMLALCRDNKVKRLVVLAFKPDSAHSLAGAPSLEQTARLAGLIRRHEGTFEIEVESCYSPLKAHLSQHFFGNSNRGISKGCGAGRDGISVNVDGCLTPCRHLNMLERFDTIEDYWYHSKVLAQLRSVDGNPRFPCAECRYCAYCLHCMAINAKLNGEIYKGNESCGLWSI